MVLLTAQMTRTVARAGLARQFPQAGGAILIVHEGRHTDSHSDWHNGGTNTFPDDGTTTEWTPTAPSKYLLVRTLTNHGYTNRGGSISVRFLQLEFGVAPN